MEPVTHILTGACLARTGFNRRAAYATLAMTVAAEFPDIDTLWGLRGPVAGFQHHRGITHTFLGIPFEAALIVAGIYGLHRWRAAQRTRASEDSPTYTAASTPASVPKRETGRPLTTAPVRWGLLYAFTLLALLSHLWLDYTNNYGLRPFFPFNPRWYAASITFIFDPLMFAMLLAALVLPPLFRLVGAEVGARRQPFAARGWAMAALLGVCGLWGWRAVEHSRALQVASMQSISYTPPEFPGLVSDNEQEPPPVILTAQRSLASPDPLSPQRWYVVTDYGPAYQLSTIDVPSGAVADASELQHKPAPTSDLLLAERAPLGRAYLDWSPMPFLSVMKADAALNDGIASGMKAGSTLVTFQDPRFMGENPWLHIARSRAPLTGTVWLDAQGSVLRQTMDGKTQH